MIVSASEHKGNPLVPESTCGLADGRCSDCTLSLDQQWKRAGALIRCSNVTNCTELLQVEYNVYGAAVS